MRAHSLRLAAVSVGVAASLVAAGCFLDRHGSATDALLCGDGRADGSEGCDGTDFAGADCVSLGFAGGNLGCLGDCTLDVSGCIVPPDPCGNGTIDPGEGCDGTDFGGTDCLTLGFIGGAVACSAACKVDSSGCTQAPCGNGNLDDGEECDGADLAGQTCAGLGLGPGTLVCSPTCTIDRAGCSGCGNGSVEGNESCDGLDLAGQSCDGALVCTGECWLDATACTLGTTADGVDGDLLVDTSYTLGAGYAPSFAVTTVGASSVGVAGDASGLQPGDEVMLVNMQGGAAGCDAAGAHEFLHVTAATTAEVDFDSAVQEVYGVGGNVDLTGQKLVLVRVPHFQRVDVTATGLLTVAPWDGSTGGLLVMRVAEELRVEAGGRVDVGGRGFRGGAGYSNTNNAHGRPGESACGFPQAAGFSPNLGGGGGGKWMDTSDNCGQGGGGAAYGTAGGFQVFSSDCQNAGANAPAANGGVPYGDASLGRLLVGSGGGAGASDDHSNDSGSGGPGGGAVLVFAHTITVHGSISAGGAAGGIPGDTTDSGNGGGGSGGAIHLHAGFLNGTGVVTALGGAGGPSQNGWNSAGGDGGVGRVRVDHHHAGGAPYGAAVASDFVTALCSPAPGYGVMTID